MRKLVPVAIGVALACVALAVLQWRSGSERGVRGVVNSTIASANTVQHAPRQGGTVLTRPPVAPFTEEHVGTPAISAELPSATDADASSATPSPEEMAVHFSNRFDGEAGQQALRGAEQSIARRFDTVAPVGVEITSTECRQTTCRLSVRFTDAEADREFFRLMFAEYSPQTEDQIALSRLGGFVAPRSVAGDGTIATTIYLSQ